MLFNSWEFLILLAVTFVLYYAPWSRGRHGKAWQVMLALVASVIFYGWEDPKLIGLLAISCVGNSIAIRQSRTDAPHIQCELFSTPASLSLPPARYRVPAMRSCSSFPTRALKSASLSHFR